MLSKDQEIAYQRICKFINSKETEIILSGSPGTGKSFLIQELSKKFDIDLTATTNKAADVIDGQTIYSYLGIVLKEDYKTGKQTLDTRKAKYIYKKIVVIDECSMINEDLYNALNKYCQGSKIIYVGDWYQLPPVCSNFSIFNQNIETVFLNEIMRTDKEDIKELLSSLKKCNN